ncbi:hypothetical protein CBOM_05696 [Ceraceosorus bombacis]|uniref:Uncharacterized protein n=1 Tax=Ceraceosorus bombacis TaxID=401625 RepID=A0A0P1BPW5_9BASI|nr:hypothetical protein CBOM_05696 [Ceraceosorus bombacis]
MQMDGTGEPTEVREAAQAEQMPELAPGTSAVPSSMATTSLAAVEDQDNVTFVRIENSTGRGRVIKVAAGGGDEEVVFVHIKEGKGARYSDAQWTPFKANPDGPASGPSTLPAPSPSVSKRIATGSPLLGQTPSKRPGILASWLLHVTIGTSDFCSIRRPVLGLGVGENPEVLLACAATLNAEGNQHFQQSKNWPNIGRVSSEMQTDGTGEPTEVREAAQAKQMPELAPGTSAVPSSTATTSLAAVEDQDSVTFVRIENSTGRGKVIKVAAGRGNKEVVFVHIKEGKGQCYSKVQWTLFKANPDGPASDPSPLPASLLTKSIATRSPLPGKMPGKQPGIPAFCPAHVAVR